MPFLLILIYCVMFIFIYYILSCIVCSVVVSGSIVNTHTKIGKHCIINTGSCIEHENIFDDYVSCGPKVTTGGNVKIKSSSFIGMRSVIQHKISIGKNTVIGANSFVNRDCGDNMIY